MLLTGKPSLRRIEVAGTKGTLQWRQEEPEAITILLAGHETTATALAFARRPKTIKS